MMNKWAPGLIIFGVIFGLLSTVTLLLCWGLCRGLAPPSYDTFTKIQMMFRTTDAMVCITWSALLGLTCSIALFIRGVWLLKNSKHQ